MSEDAREAVERMTEIQAIRVADCARLFRERGREVVWHFNHCGCCVSVHDAADVGGSVVEGYIVNRQGDATWERCS
jgi:hypothetical protein